MLLYFFSRHKSSLFLVHPRLQQINIFFDQQLMDNERCYLYPKPSVLHATLAAASSKSSSHTVPHSPAWKTSKRPARSLLPPTSLSAVDARPEHKCHTRTTSVVHVHERSDSTKHEYYTGCCKVRESDQPLNACVRGNSCHFERSLQTCK